MCYSTRSSFLTKDNFSRENILYWEFLNWYTIRYFQEISSKIYKKISLYLNTTETYTVEPL